jgi:hypothetical protein
MLITKINIAKFALYKHLYDQIIKKPSKIAKIRQKQARFLYKAPSLGIIPCELGLLGNIGNFYYFTRRVS